MNVQQRQSTSLTLHPALSSKTQALSTMDQLIECSETGLQKGLLKDPMVIALKQSLTKQDKSFIVDRVRLHTQRFHFTTRD